MRFRNLRNFSQNLRMRRVLPQCGQPAGSLTVCGTRWVCANEATKERKDRVDDAMHATCAAVEEGILPGGGVALLRASEVLKKLRTQNDDQKTGVEIVRKALSATARQIASNAGEDGSVIVGKILEKDQYAYGFDAQNGEPTQTQHVESSLARFAAAAHPIPIPNVRAEGQR